MKRGLMLGSLLFLGTFVVATPAQAALTPNQVNAIVLLLTSFGADQSVIVNVWMTLTGSTQRAWPVASSLTFTAGAQPEDSDVSASTANVPFITFTLANNTSAPATIQSVTIRQVGKGSDYNFSTIALLGSDGRQVGSALPLDDHQVDLGENFILSTGQSVALTVVGNISDRARPGQTVRLQIVALNASVPVSGDLPISGASHTVTASH